MKDVITIGTASVMALTIMARKATDGEGKPLLLKAAEDSFAHIQERHPERVAEAEAWLAVVQNDSSKSLDVAKALDELFSAS